MKKTISILALLSTLFITNAKAQLKFKNSRNHPLHVAIADYVKTDEFEGWYCKGWCSLEPNETKTLIGVDLQYTTYYFYAIDSEGSEWKGGGKYSFMDKFKGRHSGQAREPTRWCNS